MCVYIVCVCEYVRECVYNVCLCLCVCVCVCVSVCVFAHQQPKKHQLKEVPARVGAMIEANAAAV